ncbi:MAG: alpha/beta hydrolase [Planctomycetes bacterium]|nr:alpha/beta hydrolase [Planctomycetota bacterium]
MTGLISLLALGLLIALAAMTLYTVHVLTHPPRRTYASALARNRPGDPSELPAGPRDFGEWGFDCGDLRLPVWEISGDAPQGPTVILVHGWGDSRIGALSRIPHLLPLARRVITFDMRGHGEAAGLCMLGVREPNDLAALMDHLKSPVVLMGWSLGAGVCIAAAAARPEMVRAVITEAPYRLARTPARNVIREWALPYRVNLPPAMWLLGIGFGVGPSGLNSSGFDRAEFAARVRCPLLVLHGEFDSVCPPADGREIAAAAGGVFVPITGAGHHGMWTTPESCEQCVGAIGKFLAGVPADRD